MVGFHKCRVWSCKQDQSYFAESPKQRRPQASAVHEFERTIHANQMSGGCPGWPLKYLTSWRQGLSPLIMVSLAGGSWCCFYFTLREKSTATHILVVQVLHAAVFFRRVPESIVEGNAGRRNVVGEDEKKRWECCVPCCTPASMVLCVERWLSTLMLESPQV